MRKLRDWVFSIPTVIAFGLTLGVFHIAGLVALPFGRRAFDAVMGSLQRTLLVVFRISGIRVEADRHPAVADDESYIFVSNHQSMFDIPIIGGLLYRNHPKYIAKRELARGIPSVSLNLRKGGHALIDRKDRDGAIAAIEALAARIVADGHSAVIFPEGSRSRDGRLRPFRPAGTIALLDAAPDLAVVPTVIDGSWRVFAHNLLPTPFGASVKVTFGEPLRRLPGEDSAGLLERAAAVIRSTLGEGAAPATG